MDIVEYASVEGGPAAYDVSVVASLRKDRRFVNHCASRPGYAAATRYRSKLDEQYADRLPHTHLLPLVAESGGRWHPEAQTLLRQLARAYVRRTPGFDDSALSAVVSRWATRLSAVLLRGNAAILRSAGWTPRHGPRNAVHLSGPLAHVVPEGDSVYELLVEPVHILQDDG